ncbi:MAG: hypothetical protein HPY52_16810 [Firmicutes bacterium]|nr:hypothetical protein [Bacillota bacterium]
MTDRKINDFTWHRIFRFLQDRNREQLWTLKYRDRIREVLADPDRVIIDPEHGEDTLIHYKFIPGLNDLKGRPYWLAVVVQKGDYKYFYTMYPYRKGTVLGYRVDSGLMGNLLDTKGLTMM